MSRAMKYYIAASVDLDVRAVSSSGGIFTLLAREVFAKSGSVFAAGFDAENYSVRHMKITKEHELSRVRKSKYVWSDYKCIEAELRCQLDAGQQVMFVGVPCQAYYIKKKYGHYSNLLVVDLFCHGTAEAAYFKEYLEAFQESVKEFDFRGQDRDSSSNFQVVIKTKHGICEWPFEQNIFTKAYVESVSVRRACFTCRLSENAHISDITLGDFSWPERAKKRNVDVWHPSIVALNTELGINVFETLKDEMHFTNRLTEDEIEYYHRPHTYTGSWGYNIELKDGFEKDHKELGFIRAAYKNIFPHEYNLIMQLANRMENSIVVTYYLYGNGVIAGRLKRAITDICPEMEFLGYVVTNKTEDSPSVISVDEYAATNKDIPIVVAVSGRYVDEICAELDRHKIKGYIFDRDLNV